MANLIISDVEIKLDSQHLNHNLSGISGINRSINRPLIDANDDISAIKAWLVQFSDKKTTFDNYRKEVERLLMWAVNQHGKPVSSLMHEDLQVYKRFLLDPQPANKWIMIGKKVARAHPDWRPFAGPLSPLSQKQAVSILNNMFSWLVNAGYLASNPFTLIKQRRSPAKPRIVRFLEEDLWAEVKITIETMPKETIREREHYTRSKWIFTLVYLTGMRISEIIQNDMGKFFSRKDKSGEHLWWLEITGKGDKTRLIPATKELMDELSRYRREIGLPILPIEGETIPMVLPIGGKHKALTRGALHLMIKQVFNSTAERLELRGPEGVAKATRLRAASTHWLRHTAGSDMADHMDLRHVRDNLGHSNLSTTNKYLHTEDDKRHKDTDKHHKINW